MNENQLPATNTPEGISSDYRPLATDLAQRETANMPLIPVDSSAALIQQHIPQTVHDMAIQMFRESETFEPTEEQKAILFSPVNSDAICVRQHDGQIYIPTATYRALLTQAFPLQWMIMPDSPMPKVEKNLVIWGFYLKIKGVLMGHAIGAQKYIPSNSQMEWDDAMEGAKSNTLMRLCKALGMMPELWDPNFINKWKKENVESYLGTNSRGQTITLWRKKSAAMKNSFRIATNELNWTSDQIADYMCSHCPVMDLKSGEITFKTVESRTEYTPGQWDLQEKHLQYLVDNPDSRPNFDSKADEADPPPQDPPETSTGVTEPSEVEKQAGVTPQPSTYPEHMPFLEQLHFYADWVERSEEAVMLWLEVNYVCDFKALYEDKIRKIKAFLHDTYKSDSDGTRKAKFQNDIDTVLKTFYSGKGASSPAREMIHALAECSQEQIDEFLEKLDVKKSSGGKGPRQVRGMTMEQFALWRQTLDAIKSPKPEPESEILEPDDITIPDEEREAARDDNQEDIPF